MLVKLLNLAVRILSVIPVPPSNPLPAPPPPAKPPAPAAEPEPVPALPPVPERRVVPRPVPPAKTFKVPITEAALDVAARTVFGEARGEAWLGRVAVAWVLRNRVVLDLWGDGKPDWWGEGLIAVCRAPFQFSCWNDNDPNCAVLHALPADTPALVEIRDLVAAVFRGEIPDPTAGATHYYAPKAVKAAPAWARGRSPSATIGNHLFFAKVEQGDI